MPRALIATAALALASTVPTAQAQLPPDLRLETVQAGFSGITAIRAPDDGSGRLFVLEQSGRIRIFDGDATLATPFLRLCASAGAGCFVPPGGFTSSGSEQGLLGLAFHPQFAGNRQVYLNYTNAGGNTVIARVQAAAGNADLADSASFAVLLTISQDFGNHNGGDIHFGPDGYLYIGMGDGGSGGDPCSRSQTLDPALLCNGASNDGQTGCPSNSSCGPGTRGPSRALLGKMLRIDVDATTPAGSNRLCAAAADGSAPYAIPPTNPYASTTSNCAETWAAGLRNPWRFSFDRQTDDLLIGDVGQNQGSGREEVTLYPAASAGGLNLGWRCREGFNTRSTGAPVCNAPPAFTDPIFEYLTGSESRCAITGGYRYRGPAPSLQGLYFYGDACGGRIMVATESTGNWTQQYFSPSSIGSIRTFGEDSEGNVYVGTSSTVFLLTGDVPTDLIFENGFEAP